MASEMCQAGLVVGIMLNFSIWHHNVPFFSGEGDYYIKLPYSIMLTANVSSMFPLFPLSTD